MRRFAVRESVRLWSAGASVIDAAAAVGEHPATVARWIAARGDYSPPPAAGGLGLVLGPADAALRARWPRYHHALDSMIRACEIEALEAECDACTHDAALLEREGLTADAQRLRGRVLAMMRRIDVLTAADRETVADW